MSRDGPSRAAVTAALIEEEQRRIDAFLGRRQVAHPPARRALLIAPHPDDNLFAAGGTALRFAAAGVAQHWACVTDGRACVTDTEERARMATRRAEEERAVAAAMGVPEPTFLEVPEDEIVEADPISLAERIAALLAKFRPDAVLVPFFLEIHPLHRLTAHLAALALQRYRRSCKVYSWALGSFPPPSLVVDVTEQFPRKLELAALYRSQFETRDYAADLELLGRFQARAYGPPAAQFCEVFFEQEREEYVADILARGLDRPETLQAGHQPVLEEHRD